MRHSLKWGQWNLEPGTLRPQDLGPQGSWPITLDPGPKKLGQS